MKMKMQMEIEWKIKMEMDKTANRTLSSFCYGNIIARVKDFSQTSVIENCLLFGSFTIYQPCI